MNKKVLITLLCLLVLISGTHFSTHAQENAPYLNERKIVFFRNSAQAYQFNQWLQANHQEDSKDFQAFPALDSFAVRMTDDIKNILYCYGNQVLLMDDISYKNYPLIKTNTNVSTDQNWNLAVTEAPSLWKMGHTGKEIKIAILDTGIDGTHEAFKNRIVDYAQFSRYGGIYRDDPKNSYDTDNHGTHVAGIAAGRTDDNIIGIAPDAYLSSGVVIPGGMGSLSQIFGGLEWVMDPDGDPNTNDQARIVNLSLGMPGYIKIWTPIFKKLLERNILPVSAIGNDGDGVCGNPASTPNVLAVGAFDQDFHPASFSSGSDRLIWEDSFIQKNQFIKPDLSAPGVQIYSAIPGNAYARMSGTSMSSPHIAGAAALLMSAFPEASAWDIWHYLILGCDDRGDPGPDSRYGAGSLNLKQSYELLSKSHQFSGSIRGDFANCDLINRQRDMPVYLNPDGKFSTVLISGNYDFDLFYKGSFLRRINLSINQENYSLDISVPEIAKMQFRGVVKDSSGNPLQAVLTHADQSWKTDEMGRFSVGVDHYETITVRSSGYVEQTIYSMPEDKYINIRLSKADLLLLEGYSHYLTSVNPPRAAHRFYLDSFKALGKKAAYINAEEESYTFDDIKNYPFIVYFCESGTLSSKEHEIFRQYIDQGGRVIFSGRMLLSLESYLGYNFLADRFGIKNVREYLVFPSIKTVEGINDMAMMDMSLSGDTGANNQETCDVIPLAIKPPFVEPFLQFSEVTGERYAGLRKADGISKTILLSFGIEGIGSETARTKLLDLLLLWMKPNSIYQADIASEGTFYLTITDDEDRSKTIELNGNTIYLGNLLPQRYTFLLEGYSFMPIEYEIDFSLHQYYYERIVPVVSTKYDVNFVFRQEDIMEGFYRLQYKSENLLSGSFSLGEVLNLKLPQGQYKLMVTAKNLTPYVKEFTIEDHDLVFEEDLVLSKSKVLIIDDSKIGGYYRDANKVQEQYGRFLLSQGIGYDNWDVVTEGYPEYFSLITYSLIIYLSGYNSYTSFSDDIIFDTLSQYLENGGSLVFLGLGAPVMLREKPFLKEYAGISVLSSNTRERTVHSMGSDKFPNQRFDIYTSYSEGPARFPAFKAEKEGVYPIFHYVNSGLICSTVYQHQRYKVGFFPFGAENIILPSVKEEFLKGIVSIFHNELAQ